MKAVIYFCLSFFIQHLHATDSQECGSVAFHVYRTTSYVLSGTTINYEEAHVNTGSMNLETGVFHAPFQGIYIFNFLAARQETESCFHVQLKHNGLTIGFAGSSCSWGPAPYIALLHLEKNDQVWMNLRQGMTKDNDNNWHLHFMGFMIANLPSFSLKSAFNVFHNSAYSANNWTYNGIYTDINADVDLKTGTFTAPVDGVYFFQFLAATDTRFDLIKENYQTIETAHVLDKKMSSAICHSIVSMKRGEILQARLMEGSVRDNDRHTCFIGFLMYELNAGGRPVYFHVGRMTSSIKGVITYDHVILNVRHGMDPKSGVFTAPGSGVYAFYFVAYKGDKKECSIVRQMHNNVYVGMGNNCVTNNLLNFNSILRLRKGDQVKMVLWKGDIASDTTVITRFSGFLIYPIHD